MVKFVPVSETDVKTLDYIRSVYEDSFPVDERREFDQVKRLLKENETFHLAVIEKDGRGVGLLSYWQWPDWRYVEHFAVDGTCRGKGIGREILQAFIAEDDTPIVLEVEHPDDDICIRRIRFYESLGFVLHPEYDYIQPPYDATKHPLHLYLMTCRMTDFATRYQEIKSRLYAQVYGVEKDV